MQHVLQLHEGAKRNPTLGGILWAIQALSREENPVTLRFTDTNNTDHHVIVHAVASESMPFLLQVSWQENTTVHFGEISYTPNHGDKTSSGGKGWMQYDTSYDTFVADLQDVA